MTAGKHATICSHCGQEVTLPEDFKGLQLTPSLNRVLNRLFVAKGRLVPYFSLAGDGGTKSVEPQAVYVYISRIRSALREIGSEWEIVKVSLNYKLVKRECDAREIGSSERAEVVHS